MMTFWNFFGPLFLYPLFSFWVWPRFPTHFGFVRLACLTDMFGRERKERKSTEKKAKKPLKLPLPQKYIYFFELISCGCCKPSVCRFVIGRVYQMLDSFLLDNPRCPTRSHFFWGIWNWLIQHDKYFQIPFNFFDISELPLSPWSIVVR